MKNNFTEALSFTLRMEGGTNFLVEDRGGLTNFGISQRQYPNLDIRNLTFTQAKDIYYKDYWLACRCDLFPQPLATVLFDTAVNCGVHSSKVWFQKSLGVTADGVIGPITLRAYRLRSYYDLCGKILGLRLRRYDKLVRRDSSQRIFILGWMARVYKLLAFI